MPRTIEVTVPSDKAEALVATVRKLDGVVGLALQRGVSLDPPGDIVTIQATNDGTRSVLAILDQVDAANGGSILTSEPRSLISRPYQNGIDQESNETIWDEMAFLLRRETNLSPNYLALMALSGGIAAVGLWTDTLHIVIGAMVLAPGFEPLLRIPFGAIAGPRVLASRGIASSLAGYGMLALGAALTLLVLRAIDSSRPPDLETRVWVEYWSKVSGTSMLLAFVAGAAGAFVVTGQRSVLSAGVMIALALIPAMCISAMALVSGDLALTWQGLARWFSEAGSVVVASALVLGAKQLAIHRRTALG